MPTPYSTIYNKFLSRISDYQLLNLLKTDVTSGEDTMKNNLDSAIVRFSKCKTDLTDIDDVKFQFNQSLTLYEIDILAMGMILDWIEPQVNNILLLTQVLNNGDFKTYSSANLLDKLLNLQEKTQLKLDRLIVDYTYDTASDFSKLS